MCWLMSKAIFAYLVKANTQLVWLDADLRYVKVDPCRFAAKPKCVVTTITDFFLFFFIQETNNVSHRRRQTVRTFFSLIVFDWCDMHVLRFLRGVLDL